MRNPFLAILALTLVAVLGVGVFILYFQPPQLANQIVETITGVRGTPRPSPRPAEADSEAEGKGRQKTDAKRRFRKSVSPDAAQVPLSSVLPELKLPEVNIEVEPPPFPTTETVKLGLPRSSLLAKFGDPNLKATTIHQRQLVETYVYFRLQRSRATFVMLKDGDVVGVQTEPVIASRRHQP